MRCIKLFGACRLFLPGCQGKRYQFPRIAYLRCSSIQRCTASRKRGDMLQACPQTNTSKINVRKIFASTSNCNQAK